VRAPRRIPRSALPRVPRSALPRVLLAILPALAGGARAEEPFEILELPVKGRTVAAAIAELDGDGRADLLAVNFRGVPPDERREIHVRYQRADGGFGLAADAVLPLPPDAAAWDLAGLGDDADARDELLLLRRDRVTRLSLHGRRPSWRDVDAGGPTLAIAPDERGLDPLALVRTGIARGPHLLIPGLGEVVVVLPSGAIVARLETGARANYFIPPRPGPLIGENEVEVYLDQPRIELGDVDGDGLLDVVTSQRHEIRVFRQRAGGALAPVADRVVPLRRLSAADHVRGSGSVRSALADLDGDGRVDLLITHAAEGLLDARSETRVHLNRDGAWNLAEPDQRFTTAGGFATEELVDLDGDGALELVSVRVPLGLLELAEMLVTRSVDAHVAIRQRTPGGPSADAPSYRRKFSVPFSFETFRPRGFIGNVATDWNGDGLRDLLLSGDGEALEVYLGAEERPFAKRAGRQGLDTDGRLRAGDLDGDGLADFVLFDPRRADAPIRVGRNRGVLPGTPRRSELRATP